MNKKLLKTIESRINWKNIPSYVKYLILDPDSESPNIVLCTRKPKWDSKLNCWRTNIFYITIENYFLPNLPTDFDFSKAIFKRPGKNG